MNIQTVFVIVLVFLGVFVSNEDNSDDERSSYKPCKYDMLDKLKNLTGTGTRVRKSIKFISDKCKIM